MKAAASIAKRLEEGGLQLAGLQPTNAVKTLTYTDLSNMADAIVADIHKRFPDAFSDENPQGMYPTYLKFYLLIGMWDFLRRYASFSFSTGVPQVPSTPGYIFPSALIAWLSYLVPYEEGGSIASIKYVLDGVPSTGINAGIVGTGTALVTDISASAYYTIWNIVEDSATKEAIGRSTAISAVDMGSLWSTYADGISTKLQGLDYPTMPMPVEWEKPAPDASAWSKPHTVGGGTTTLQTVARLANSFARWNEELALLFLDDVHNYSGQNAARSTRPVPRLTRIIGVDTGGTAVLSGTFGVCQRARENFVMLMRHSGSYEPGKPIFSHLSFCGEKIRTLNCNPRPINLYRLKWASFIALDQLINNTSGGITIDSTLVWIYELCVRYAVAARTRLTQVGWELYSSQVAGLTCGRAAISSRWYGEVRLPIPIALLANDFGAVVQDGELQWPMIEDWGDYWYKGYTFPNVNNVWRFDDPVVTSTSWSTTALRWQNVNLNLAWVTAYDAITNRMLNPFYSADRIVALLARALGSGAGFGRGDMSYAVSGNPRGGASMVATCNFSLSLGQTSAIDVGAYTTPAITIYPLGGVYANAQLSGEDLGMAYLLGAVRSFSNTEYQTARNSASFPASVSADTVMSNFILPGCSNGGIVIKLLADAFERIHSVGGSFVYGDAQLQDTCLWDSMKGVLGSATRAIVKVAPIAAGVGCNIVVPGSGKICSGVAKMAGQAILDASSLKTNRQSFANPVESTEAVVREVQAAETRMRDAGMPVGNAVKTRPVVERRMMNEIKRFEQSTRRGDQPKSKKKPGKVKASKPLAKAKKQKPKQAQKSSANRSRKRT